MGKEGTLPGPGVETSLDIKPEEELGTLGCTKGLTGGRVTI